MLQVTRAPSRTKRACEAVAVLLTACLTTSVFAAPRMAADPETRPLTFNRKGRNNTIWAFGRKSDGYVANACLQLLPWPCVLTVLFFWIMTTSCLSQSIAISQASPKNNLNKAWFLRRKKKRVKKEEGEGRTKRSVLLCCNAYPFLTCSQ